MAMKIIRTAEIYDIIYKVGDVVEFELTTGEKVRMTAVNQKRDMMEFCFTECLSARQQMNSRDTNEGGFEESLLRRILNEEIIQTFPREIYDKMVPFDNGDYLSIPAEEQVFGKNIYGEPITDDSIEQWDIMKQTKNRIALLGLAGSTTWYWLKNKSVRSASDFCLVSGNGYASSGGASSSCGVRPLLNLYNIV